MLSTARLSLPVSELPLSGRARRANPRFERVNPSHPPARRSSGVKKLRLRTARAGPSGLVQWLLRAVLSGTGGSERPPPTAAACGLCGPGRPFCDGARCPQRSAAAAGPARGTPGASPGRYRALLGSLHRRHLRGAAAGRAAWVSELGLLERLSEPRGGRSAAGRRAASLAASGLAFRLFVPVWGIMWRSLLYKITRCLSVRQCGGSLLYKVTQCLAMQRSGCCVCVNNEQPCLLLRCSCVYGWLLSAFSSKAI